MQKGIRLFMKKVKYLIIILLIIIFLGIVYYFNKINHKECVEFKCVYGYCPENKYLRKDIMIIKNIDEFNKEILSQVYIYGNDFLFDRNNKDIINSKTYFNNDFFEKHNLILFTYSLYNSDRIGVSKIQKKGDTANITMKFHSVYGGPFDWSQGYCFIIVDKSINNFKIIK